MENKFNKEEIKEQLKDKFDSFKNYTDDDLKKVLDNESKINKILKNPELIKFVEDVKLYFRMLRDIVTGKYKKIPFGTIATIVCTLLYVLNPQDIIPDYIPVIGYIDDAFIIRMSLRFTQFDVQKYKEEMGQKVA